MAQQHSEIVFSESMAFPTVGIILLGGVSDKITRIPRHTSAGIAYTGLNDDIYVKTRLYINRSGPKGFLNDKVLNFNKNGRSPFEIINRYKDKIIESNGLDLKSHSISFRSYNVNILSGSSDAAAAAIGKCVESLYPEKIDWEVFENELRVISESVGRSVYGGLTLTRRKDDLPVTEKLLDESRFKDFVVVGCRFASERNPSDRIHENIVTSPDYSKRIESTDVKGEKLIELAESSDIEGIFDLAQKDTDEYHKLIESVGVRVITPDMRRFINFLKESHKDFWSSYVVTGGSNVFVAVHKDNYEEIMEKAPEYNSDPVPLKVAGKAEVVNKS